jgi:hypothetical protein
MSELCFLLTLLLLLRESRPCFIVPSPELSERLGPLKGLRFLLANNNPGLGGGRPLNAAENSVSTLSCFLRMFMGNVVFVGVAGSTLTVACGLRGTFLKVAEEPEGDARDAVTDEVDDALERLFL